jgi:hypothetical protein
MTFPFRLAVAAFARRFEQEAATVRFKAGHVYRQAAFRSA